ncbi:MAG: DUF4372 domain-containing protein [Gammaproteobacteria bacterium]|nr:DUF4372 domain-containing protein [Gemmatimonadota bacterium]NIU05270.1 DUF4372 domain-containing protein [Gammaproteobacteria bacterium]NIX86543.1 DUF4372 domain-containing protein [Gammaproteobacteria bacterium]
MPFRSRPTRATSSCLLQSTRPRCGARSHEPVSTDRWISCRGTFRRCVQRYDGDAGVRRFTCWNQWPAMACARPTRRFAAALPRGSPSHPPRPGVALFDLRQEVETLHDVLDRRIVRKVTDCLEYTFFGLRLPHA